MQLTKALQYPYPNIFTIELMDVEVFFLFSVMHEGYKHLGRCEQQ